MACSRYSQLLRRSELPDVRRGDRWLGPLSGPSDDRGGGARLGRRRPAPHLGVPALRQPRRLGRRRPRPRPVRPRGGLVVTWAGDRTLYAVVASAYAGQELLRGRPRPSTSSAACAWTPRSGPDLGGAAPVRSGDHTSEASGCWPLMSWRPVTPHVFALTALWYAALPEHPIMKVVVRDPAGRRQDGPSSAPSPA